MVAVPEALAAFHTREGLPEGGTDGALFDWVTAFGFHVPIVNTPFRFAILQHHDLHHLVTGYRTDEIGEGEVSAWTLGTGGGPLFGQVYDLGGFLIGLLRAPGRVARAFWRGRQCRNLYRRPAAHWLARDLAELKAFAGTDTAPGPVTTMDRLALVGTILTAATIWITGLALVAQGVAMVAGLLVKGPIPATR